MNKKQEDINQLIEVMTELKEKDPKKFSLVQSFVKGIKNNGRIIK